MRTGPASRNAGPLACDSNCRWPATPLFRVCAELLCRLAWSPTGWYGRVDSTLPLEAANARCVARLPLVRPATRHRLALLQVVRECHPHANAGPTRIGCFASSHRREMDAGDKGGVERPVPSLEGSRSCTWTSSRGQDSP